MEFCLILLGMLVNFLILASFGFAPGRCQLGFDKRSGRAHARVGWFSLYNLIIESHLSIDAGFGFIRKRQATDAAAYEDAMLRTDLLDKTNTSRKA